MFVGSLDDDILMVKVRTERDKSKEVEFAIWCNEEQDARWRRKTMYVVV